MVSNGRDRTWSLVGHQLVLQLVMQKDKILFYAAH